MAFGALVFATSGQSVYPAPYTFSTLAGSAGVIGGADGTGSVARFYNPRGVAVDSAGNVYVADTDNNTVRKITPAGTVTTLAGLAGSLGSADGTSSAARFYNPWGVAVDSASNLYVADSYNHTIRKITPVGTNWVVTTLAGSAGLSGSLDGTGSGARFNYPFGVAVDSAGINVYVADSENNTIRKITSAGTNWNVTTLAGSAGAFGSADGTGNAARFHNPRSVAVDSAGNLYVADYLNSMIRKITPAGAVTTLAGSTGVLGSADGTGSAAQFYYPFSVAVDSTGNTYVADTFNHTIRNIVPTGAVTTLAGNAGVVGSADGTGSAARFYYPEGVAADTLGNVYVADTGNHTIRKAVHCITLTCTTNKTVSCGVAWNFDPPAATNSCYGTNVTFTILSTTTNSSPCPTVITRTWSAMEQTGYSNTCSQTVTVTDTTPPVLACATNKTVGCGSAWAFEPPTAASSCSGTNVTFAILSTVTNGGPCSQVITRTWQATDACGNNTACSQTVTVVDSGWLNLTLRLPFDEASGATAYNVAGGNNGTRVGGPTSQPGPVGAGAICLDGVSGYVDVPSYPGINPGSEDFSIDLWVRRATNDSGLNILVDKRDELGTGRGYSLYLNAGQFWLHLNDGTPGDYNSSITLPVGTWHHLAVTVERDGTGQFYYDGQPAGPSFDPTAHQGLVGNSQPFRVGARSAYPAVAGAFFNGCVDEVEFFRRALRSEEVNRLYEARSQGRCQTFCNVPLIAPFCAADQAITLQAFIFNAASSTQTFNCSFQGLPAGAGFDIEGPTNFTTSPTGPLSVPPGGLTNLSVTITRPAGMTSNNLVAGYQMLVQNAGGGEALHYQGRLRDARKICAQLPDNPLASGDGAEITLALTITNTSGTNLVLPFRVGALRPDGQFDTNAVRLSDLPAGTSVTNSLSLAAGGTVYQQLPVEFEGQDAGPFYGLLIEVDNDGDGALEGWDYTTLSSVVPRMDPPTILQHPTNAITSLGGPVGLNVTAYGTEPLSYQWYCMPPGESAFLALPGQTSSTLAFTNVQLTNFGFYRVAISNAVGQINSSAKIADASGLTCDCLFVNPSFDADAWPPRKRFFDFAKSITGWVYSDNGGYGGGAVNLGTRRDGPQWVLLDGGDSTVVDPDHHFPGHASIEQTVSGFAIGGRYHLTFWITSEEKWGCSLSVTLTGATALGPTSFAAPPASGGGYWNNWIPATLDFVCTDPSVNFRFQHTGQVSGLYIGVGLDDLCISPLLAVSPDVTICRGDCVTLTNNASRPTYWSWANAQGLQADVEASSLRVCPDVTTTYTVTALPNGVAQVKQVTVHVEDTPPTIQCPVTQFTIFGTTFTYPKVYVLYADDNCETTVPRIRPIVSDKCSLPVVITQNPARGTKFTGTGTHSILVTATDSAGNSASCNVKVLIKDRLVPILSCPPPITVSDCRASVPQLNTDAHDNCSMVVTTQEPPAGTQVGPGEHYIVVTAQDASRNINRCYTKFTVISPGPQPLELPPSNTGLQDIGQPDAFYTARRHLPSDSLGSALVVDLPPVPPVWLPNGLDSKWISAQTPDQFSDWEYTTSFVLPMPSRFELNGQWAADDCGVILLNGQPTGNRIDYFGADTWHPFSIVGTDCATNQTLSFIVTNIVTADVGDTDPTGLRVEFFTNLSTYECCTSCIPPVILMEPEDQNGVYDSATPVTFRVQAAGTPDLSYQWYYMESLIMPGQNPFRPFPGANGPTLAIHPPSSPPQNQIFYDPYAYEVVVSNACGSVTSIVARAHWDYPPSPCCAGAITWQWRISDLACPLCAELGPAIQPFGLAQGPEFGWTTDFGIPDLNGRPAYVMKSPQTAPDAGFRITPGIGANGGGSRVNQYTLIMDVLFPASSSGTVRALLQSNPDNTDDAEFFLDANNGLGAEGQFDGEVPADTWKRLALVVDLAAAPPTVSKFIDGVNVGNQSLSEGLDGRWSLNPSNSPQPYVLLFTDDNGETQEGYVSAIQFRGDVLTDVEVASLGFASSEGIPLNPGFLFEPVLSISLDQGTPVLSWFGDGLQLQEADDVAAPIKWVDSTLVVGVRRVGDQNNYVATANRQNLRKFYRLIASP